MHGEGCIIYNEDCETVTIEEYNNIVCKVLILVTTSIFASFSHFSKEKSLKNYKFVYRCLSNNFILIPFKILKSSKSFQFNSCELILKTSKIFLLVSGTIQSSKKAIIFIPLDK
jgi:hypothetical protein